MCCVWVDEYLVDVPKIECRGILTVWPQVLDGHSKECGNSSGE